MNRNNIFWLTSICFIISVGLLMIHKNTFTICFAIMSAILYSGTAIRSIVIENREFNRKLNRDYTMVKVPIISSGVNKNGDVYMSRIDESNKLMNDIVAALNDQTRLSMGCQPNYNKFKLMDIENEN
jgi:hypothetical protein